MQVLKKLTFSTICIGLFLSNILPFADSSQELVKQEDSNKKHKLHNVHKMSSKLLFEITLHGFLLWASMGFLMPIGILIIRMSNREECGRRLKILFYVHAVSQILSAVLATAGAVMSIKNFNNSFDNHHQRIGVMLYGIIWLQAFIGFLRPQRGSRGRSAWFFAHWLVGTAVALLGVINVYTGLLAYHEKTSRSIRLWTILFTTEISFFALFYLLQDKWVYMRKQGVILDAEPRVDIQKESTTDHC